jgi:hypothetical protein
MIAKSQVAPLLRYDNMDLTPRCARALRCSQLSEHQTHGLLANPLCRGALGAMPRIPCDSSHSLAARGVCHADSSTLVQHTPVRYAMHVQNESCGLSLPRIENTVTGAPAAESTLLACPIRSTSVLYRPGPPHSPLQPVRVPGCSLINWDPLPIDSTKVLHSSLLPPLPIRMSPLRAPPFGSTRSTESATQWPSIPFARFPFAPPQLTIFTVCRKIIVPGPLRPVWTAVP